MLETPRSVLSERVSITHTFFSQDIASISPELDEEEAGGDDNSSYSSFSEEYHRPKQNAKSLRTKSYRLSEVYYQWEGWKKVVGTRKGGGSYETIGGVFDVKERESDFL
mmetsp:Transcript_28290/g.60300  ORF Transcript_28290/g.60300 Transcript_28290/m.60300 type:complete len:109 (+) Transcript_28290:1323-1649(+)